MNYANPFNGALRAVSHVKVLNRGYTHLLTRSSCCTTMINPALSYSPWYVSLFLFFSLMSNLYSVLFAISVLFCFVLFCFLHITMYLELILCDSKLNLNISENGLANSHLTHLPRFLFYQARGK